MTIFRRSFLSHSTEKVGRGTVLCCFRNSPVAESSRRRGQGEDVS